MVSRGDTKDLQVRLNVTLKEYLQSVGVTAYTLGKWVNGVSPQTIYAVANATRRPSLEVLEAILGELRAHGCPAELSDLLQVEELS